VPKLASCDVALDVTGVDLAQHERSAGDGPWALLPADRALLAGAADDGMTVAPTAGRPG
jgi:hypothetical protein